MYVLSKFVRRTHKYSISKVYLTINESE